MSSARSNGVLGAGDPENNDSPRLRFARDQIARALLALEMVDRDQFDYALRSLQLEDDLAEAREQASRWRRSYEKVAAVLHEAEPERAAELDRIIREWVGKA